MNKKYKITLIQYIISQKTTPFHSKKMSISKHLNTKTNPTTTFITDFIGNLFFLSIPLSFSLQNNFSQLSALAISFIFIVSNSVFYAFLVGNSPLSAVESVNFMPILAAHSVLNFTKIATMSIYGLVSPFVVTYFSILDGFVKAKSVKSKASKSEKATFVIAQLGRGIMLFLLSSGKNEVSLSSLVRPILILIIAESFDADMTEIGILCLEISMFGLKYAYNVQGYQAIYKFIEDGLNSLEQFASRIF